jgi:hypothetical protein
MVPVAGGDDEMTVGAFDMVSDGIEVVSGDFVVDVGWDFELVVGTAALDVVRVEGLVVMSVVELAADSEWNPADAAKPEADEAPAVGGTTELVLLSVKNENEEDVGLGKEETESLLAGMGVWIGVDELLLGCTSPADELEVIVGFLELGMIEGLESTVLEELRGTEEEDNVEEVLDPPPTAGWPAAILEVEVIPTFETAFVEVEVGCVVVPEEIVPAEFCIDDALSAPPGTREPSDDVDVVTFELVDMCVDVVLIEVVELVTWLELSEERSEDVVGGSDVVSGIGTMVTGGKSVSDAELEPPIVRVVFEKGTSLGKLTRMSAFCRNGTPGATYCLPFPSRRTNPAELRVASKSTAETTWDPIMMSTSQVAVYRLRKLVVSGTK